MTEMTFDQAIEQAGTGRFQNQLMLICGVGWAADAMEVLLISFVLPAVTQEWKLSTGQAGLLGTAIFLGMLAGAWFWGRVSDLVGRKVGFIATVAIYSIFGLASAFAPSFEWLLVLRVLTGFGVGGNLPVDYSIFAEYLPPARRGRYLVLLESFWALGSVLAAGLAWLIVPTLGWRWLLGVPAAAAVVIFFIRRYVPESPRYLMVQGRQAEALAVLGQVARTNGRSLPAFTLLAPAKAVPARLSDLLRSSLRRTTLALWGIWFFLSLGYYGVFTWLPSFFRTHGLTLLPVYQNAFILALAQLPGYFSAAWLVERWGRRKTMALYLLGSAVFTFLFAAVTSLEWMLGMGIFMSFFTLGAWGALYAYTPEAFPTNLRGTGIGAASGWARIAGVMAPSMGALLLGQGLLAALAVFALSYALASGLALLLPETGQKPLQDMLK